MDIARQSGSPIQVEFTGSTGEYFRSWNVNLVLTILTLGIYSAWAKVRSKRYFYGSTLIADSAFEYTADPIRILMGRIIAVVLFIAYQVCLRFDPTVAGVIFVAFLLFVPAIYVMNMAFRMRYSTWRGINFNFVRDYRAAYLLFAPLLIYITAIGLSPLIFGIGEDVLLGPGDGPGNSTGDDSEELTSELNIYSFFILGAGFLAMSLFPIWQMFYYRFI